jgi:hypothetical protein
MYWRYQSMSGPEREEPRHDEWPLEDHDAKEMNYLESIGERTGWQSLSEFAREHLEDEEESS